MLPLFTPWSLLPWDVAWFVYRGATILLLLWSIRWAYSLRPLPTAILVVILAFPMAANLDTGNINLLLALMVFAAHFTGGRLGGFLWGIATWMKWSRRRCGSSCRRAPAAGASCSCSSAPLSLALLPLTILQLRALFGFGERPFRADYLVFIWAAVPWWWQLDDPFAFLRPRAWVEAASFRWRRLALGTGPSREAPATRCRAGAVATSARGRRWAGRVRRHPQPRTASITPVAADAAE